jgi:pSer/pThr/pTyr-binding forkhead associated (FHA) protein
MQIVPGGLFHLCSKHGVWFDTGEREYFSRVLQAQIVSHRELRRQRNASCSFSSAIEVRDRSATTCAETLPEGFARTDSAICEWAIAPTMSSDALTRSDSAKREWAIDDEVVQLRGWATDTIHALPEPPINECTLGASDGCEIHLHDPAGLVSRVHARLVRSQGHWLLVDACSKNGLRLDGARRSEIVLEPGLEIGIGGLVLVAESALSIALRAFLARLLGYGPDHAGIVDQALRSVRMAARRRAALVLCGHGDLIPIAYSIHRHSGGPDRPFIVCDPRRQSSKATVRSPENYSAGMQALAAAAGGTLCVRRQRLPADFREVAEALRSPSSRTQLVVCAETLEDCEPYRMIPIVIPQLADRQADLDRIISEYAAEAVNELVVPLPGFLPEDHAWVREHDSASLPDIEKATLRLVALRASRNLGRAAERLGMARVSLSRWIDRRRLPMEIE